MKITRRTKLLIVALALCITTMVGSTLAWFTDEVTSANNVIESGTLKVELYVSDDGTNWTEVEDGSAPIFNYSKWEPGYTTYKFFRIKNAGDLALKFQLNLKADSAITGDYKLADVIDVYTGTAVPIRANLGTKVGTLSALMDDVDGAAYGVLEAGKDTSMCIALKMQESAGNEYQGLSVGTGFSMQLLATQAMVETDAFGNDYDAAATYSKDVWNGDIPSEKPATLLVDEATKTITITSAEELLYLNELAKESYSRGYDWTVKLAANVDLANRPINTISLKKWGHFDGQGHTISNVVLNDGQTGLFTNLEGISTGKDTFKNLTVDGITVYAPKASQVGAVFANTNAKVTNVTVKNANVTGGKAVGALAGKASSVVGCKAIDCVVTIPSDGEKTVGGLVGYIVVDGHPTTVINYVENNVVENVTVSGPYNVGGMFGQAQGATGPMVVKNNTVKNVNVYYYKSEGYSAPEVGGAQVAARIVGDVKEENNTVENCTVSRTMEVYGLTLIPNGENSKIIVKDKEGFLNLSKLSADWRELFTDGNGTAYTNYANGAGGDYYYSGRWTIVLDADIDLKNNIIDPVKLWVGESSGAPTFDGNNHTISNAKIVTDATTENEAGLFNASSVAFKNLKLDNIRVTGSNVGNSTAGILSGSCNAGVSNITITNSSVTGGKYTGGVVGYGYTDITNCTLTNVTVKGGYKLGGIIGYICANNDGTGDVTGHTLTGCAVDGIGDDTFAGGKDKYIVGQVVGNYNCNGTCNNNTVTGMTSSVSKAIGEIEAGCTVTQ